MHRADWEIQPKQMSGFFFEISLCSHPGVLFLCFFLLHGIETNTAPKFHRVEAETLRKSEVSVLRKMFLTHRFGLKPHGFLNSEKDS